MNSLTRQLLPTDLTYLVPNNYVLRGAESPIRIVPPNAESVVEAVRTLALAHLREVWSDNFTTRYLAEQDGYTRRYIAGKESDARASIARDESYTRRYIVDREHDAKIEALGMTLRHQERMAEAERRALRDARKLEAVAVVSGKALEVLRDEVDVLVYEYSRGWFNTEHGIGIRVRRAARR